MRMCDYFIAFCLSQLGLTYRLGGMGPQWDCSGLIKGAAASVGIAMYHGCTTSWNRGISKGGLFESWGDIKDLPLNKPALLYHRDKKRPEIMAHTGLYRGDGTVIQAGGMHGTGVHTNPLYRYAWSTYAIPKHFYDEFTGKVKAPVLYGKGQGYWVVMLQKFLMDKGYFVGKTGADGILGKNTLAAIKKWQNETGQDVTGVVKGELYYVVR